MLTDTQPSVKIKMYQTGQKLQLKQVEMFGSDEDRKTTRPCSYIVHKTTEEESWIRQVLLDSWSEAKQPATELLMCSDSCPCDTSMLLCTNASDLKSCRRSIPNTPTSLFNTNIKNGLNKLEKMLKLETIKTADAATQHFGSSLMQLNPILWLFCDDV